jgi:hypothetical protein
MSDDRTPSGYWEIEAYTNGNQIVILGIPPEDEEMNNPPFHNCDQMGCGTFDHVVARIPVMSPTPELNWSGDGPRVTAGEVILNE